MLQKSSAQKGFYAEDGRTWRVKWYIQHAESVVFTGLPAWVYFFDKKFLRAKIMPSLASNIRQFVTNIEITTAQ